MNSPPPSKSPTHGPLVEPYSSSNACEPCKRRKRLGNGQRPCTHRVEIQPDGTYGTAPDHHRSVFTTSSARRLSSGSACETCRRRKTKCDGGHPCAYCISAGIECVNNSERRKRTMAIAATSGPENTDAMERIEDRLRRIEKLMTAFTPSPLSQSTSFQDNTPAQQQQQQQQPQQQQQQHQQSAVETMVPRKLSSPRALSPSYVVRQHRHSVQGISVAKEQSELRTAAFARKGSDGNPSAAARYTTPPNSTGSQHYDYTCPGMSPSSSSPPPPPLSPALMARPTSSTTQPITYSMLNLSLSPSSSTSSNSSTQPISQPLGSVPGSPSCQPTLVPGTSPTASHESFWPCSPPNSGSNKSSARRSSVFIPQNYPARNEEWKTSTAIPSLMDQLSRRTFATTALDYSMNYPIYPIRHPTTELAMTSAAEAPPPQ